MEKWLISTLLILFFIPIVSGLEMCQDTKEINTNCTMLTPVVRNCTTYNYTIINLNGTIVEESDLTPIGKDIYSLNFTQGEGDYLVILCDDTTREVKATDKTGDKTMLAVIILLPMILGLFLLIGSATMGQQHGLLRIFMFLLSFILFFSSLHFGMLNIIKFYNFPELQEAIGTTTYWVGLVFGVIVAYFLIYFIVVMIKSVAEKKQQEMEY